MNKWRLSKDKKGGEINEGRVGGEWWKVYCYAPVSLSPYPPLSLCLLLSHSDMSVRRCFIGVSNDGRCCQGNYIAH